MAKKCQHLELSRARADDTDALMDVWYCPEPNCDFEISSKPASTANVAVAHPSLAPDAVTGKDRQHDYASSRCWCGENNYPKKPQSDAAVTAEREA
jgi:hypothetical protein